MPSSNLTGYPRSIRINFRNVVRKHTRIKTGAIGLRVKSCHWRAEFFALPAAFAFRTAIPCRAERTGLLRAWAYEISNSWKFRN
jgi:hypothetical protein